MIDTNHDTITHWRFLDQLESYIPQLNSLKFSIFVLSLKLITLTAHLEGASFMTCLFLRQKRLQVWIKKAPARARANSYFILLTQNSHHSIISPHNSGIEQLPLT